jgi:hypothetical protein
MKGHGNKAYHNNGRKMLSRINSSSISIFHSIAPGKKVNGCYVCCNAPSCCAICSIVPCCDDSHFLVAQRESSKYFHIRENSIEWNEPEIIMREGNCCGLDPCIFEVQDRVKVIYFDDSMFGKLRNVTRHCNEFRTCLFGGRGERIQISNPCCCGLGYRATCCPCVPICCPQGLSLYCSFFSYNLVSFITIFLRLMFYHIIYHVFSYVSLKLYFHVPFARISMSMMLNKESTL